MEASIIFIVLYIIIIITGGLYNYYFTVYNNYRRPTRWLTRQKEEKFRRRNVSPTQQARSTPWKRRCPRSNGSSRPRSTNHRFALPPPPPRQGQPPPRPSASLAAASLPPRNTSSAPAFAVPSTKFRSEQVKICSILEGQALVPGVTNGLKSIVELYNSVQIVLKPV